MNPIQRTRKRISVVLIVSLFLGGVGTWIYLAVRPVPTCFDGKTNQGEEKTDCGGPCPSCAVVYEAPPEDFVVRESAVLPGGQPGTYDVLARVQNPNDELGASVMCPPATNLALRVKSILTSKIM
jgi:hypothetical protein